MAAAGDNRLGGQDFNLALLQHLQAEVGRKMPGYDLAADLEEATEVMPSVVAPLPNKGSTAEGGRPLAMAAGRNDAATAKNDGNANARAKCAVARAQMSGRPSRP